MTSFIAACGSARSTSVIPAVPAAWSVTTMGFIVRLLVLSKRRDGRVQPGVHDGILELQRTEERHFSRTYHNRKESWVARDRKSLILQTERCWSGRSGTLGKRIPRATPTHFDAPYRIVLQRLSYPKLSLRVHP